MGRSLLGEIAHQIFYTPPKHKHHNKKPESKPKRDYAYEKLVDDYKKRSFETRKDVEIKKCQMKSKGFL